MFFNFPDHKMYDGVWFITKDMKTLYGMIVGIHISMDPEKCAVYYSIQQGNEKTLLIEEDHVLPQTYVPQPIYHIGDRVTFTQEDGTTSRILSGTIEEVEIQLCAKNAYSVDYKMEGSEDLINEADIKSYTIVIQKPKETTG